MQKERRFTPFELKWILYDVGNSAFVLLASTILPIYFEAVAGAAGISDAQSTAYWGYTASAVTIVTALISPILGTLADFKGKKALFLIFSLLGIVGCLFLAVPMHWLIFLFVYGIAKVGLSSSLVFYDSMLPDVTSEERLHKISSHGYAWGYIGSCIPFIVCLAIVLFSDMSSLSLILAFIITGVWWFAFTMPLARSYRQTHFLPRPEKPFKSAFKRLGQLFGELRKNKKAFLFLLAFFFYIDGVYTIIDMATKFGSALGLEMPSLLIALLVTQIVAFPSAIAFGVLTKKVSDAKLIAVCIAAYTFVGFFAVFLYHEWQFWVLAVMVGLFQGGIQALSRSYFAKLVPAEKSGEYFGVFDIFGKGAAFLGTLLFGVTTDIALACGAGDGLALHLSILPVATLFVVGFVLFLYAAKQPDPVFGDADGANSAGLADFADGD